MAAPGGAPHPVPATAPATAAEVAAAGGAKPAETKTVAMMDEKEYLTGRMWCFDPHYWNGAGWASARGVVINNRIEKKDLVVLSYNIWFGPFQQAERMRQLGMIISSHDPDIICLQEVTPPIMALLLAQTWTRSYFVSDPEGKQLNGYGVAIFSKFRMHQLALRDFPSKMGRKALIATFLQKNGTQLTVGTFHLESYPQDRPVREQQMHLYMKLLEGLPGPIVLCGDTNFSDGDVENRIFSAAGLTDAWITLKQRNEAERVANPGYTFDTSTNAMTAASAGCTIINRIDRLFYSSDRITPTSFDIIGTKPFAPNAWPSDHYGIVVNLKLP